MEKEDLEIQFCCQNHRSMALLLLYSRNNVATLCTTMYKFIIQFLFFALHVSWKSSKSLENCESSNCVIKLKEYLVSTHCKRSYDHEMQYNWMKWKMWGAKNPSRSQKQRSSISQSFLKTVIENVMLSHWFFFSESRLDFHYYF